jgi:hypothetical protein
MRPLNGDRERRHAALLDRALGQWLDAELERELDRMLTSELNEEVEAYEHAAAALHLALLPPPTEGLPHRLRERVLEQADDYFAGHASTERRPSPLTWVAWIAAAAAVALLWVGPPESGPTPGPSLADVRDARDGLSATWANTGDPLGTGVTGEVVWSDALQAGFMRFRGLPENDPAAGQYQLWIFDANQPAETPVDGGVFDSTGADVLVPIDAKLAVAAPSLFAVTYERPGGVVVSSRERLLLTATPQ